ncbi:MAG: UDP-N-acetylmuramoyl-L-alanyl-D-glutamate--2,6-diaminopimelate ligase [Gammaproteobacteria bacterium]|nr:UDP-N-acetylmuramoyl-L-alanyl-D-glutamate--2,6-diaminopimelate ligase [Gammaproteobacteria bacterium]
MNPPLRCKRLPALLAGLADAVPALPVTGIDLDSRRIEAGALFLACRGSRGHGLAHVSQALARGAGAVAYEPAPDLAVPQLGVPLIAVPSLAAQAGEIAARFYDRPSDSLLCIGITGTDGKTSTAHLLTQSLDALGRPCLYFGTLGYGRLGALAPAATTTPDPVELQRRLAQGLNADARACAMEVSSHALDQRRVAGVAFDCAVLTNVGRDHLDYHGSQQAYAAAKRRLFDLAPSAVLNLDDACGIAWAAELAGRDRQVLGYALDAAPSAVRLLRGRRLSLSAEGLSLELHAGDATARIKSPLLGRFNAYNLLAAGAGLIAAGVPLPAAAAALAGARTVPGRAEVFRAPGKPLVVVDYAHTPQALEQILQALRAHTRGRLHCVFGCGGERDIGKRPLMGEAAARLADAVVLTDDNPRGEAPAAIIAGILDGLRRHPATPVQVMHQRERAIEAAIAAAGADDVVLVAGKGHEDYQIHGGHRRRYSDRSHVAAVLGLDTDVPT